MVQPDPLLRQALSQQRLLVRSYCGRSAPNMEGLGPTQYEQISSGTSQRAPGVVSGKAARRHGSKAERLERLAAIPMRGAKRGLRASTAPDVFYTSTQPFPSDSPHLLQTSHCLATRVFNHWTRYPAVGALAALQNRRVFHGRTLFADTVALDRSSNKPYQEHQVCGTSASNP